MSRTCDFTVWRPTTACGSLAVVFLITTVPLAASGSTGFFDQVVAGLAAAKDAKLPDKRYWVDLAASVNQAFKEPGRAYWYTKRLVAERLNDDGPLDEAVYLPLAEEGYLGINLGYRETLRRGLQLAMKSHPPQLVSVQGWIGSHGFDFEVSTQPRCSGGAEVGKSHSARYPRCLVEAKAATVFVPDGEFTAALGGQTSWPFLLAQTRGNDVGGGAYRGGLVGWQRSRTTMVDRVLEQHGISPPKNPRRSVKVFEAGWFHARCARWRR